MMTHPTIPTWQERIDLLNRHDPLYERIAMQSELKDLRAEVIRLRELLERKNDDD